LTARTLPGWAVKVVCIEQPQLFRLAKLLIAGHRRRPDPCWRPAIQLGCRCVSRGSLFFRARLQRIEDVVRLVLKQPDPDEVVEKANDLNATLAPDWPAGDESGFNFRPLTEQEKKDFVGSLDANGRQILADLESPPKPVRAPRSEE
jgi:hypothetical protein